MNMTVLPCVRQGYEVDSRLSDIQLQRISEITTKQFRAIVLQTHHSALSYYVLKISKLRYKIVRTLQSLRYILAPVHVLFAVCVYVMSQLRVKTILTQH